MPSRLLLSFLGLCLLSGDITAQGPGNLLRNGQFQDDWLTLLPETKNHHWCYSSEFYNRRDFNPDGWTCKGSWLWLNAEGPAGQRRLVLQGPSAELVQKVNWVAVHDDRSKEGWPDAGGFPSLKPQRTVQPLRVVRDLTLRVRVKGQAVPAKAGGIEVAWPTGNPASTAWPEGTYEGKWVEVKLAAADWLKAVKEAAAKDPKEVAEQVKAGPALPDFARVTLRYQGKTGRIEVEHAELVEPGPEGPNLVSNGNFDSLDATEYPEGWSHPVKYRYFPPGHYYIFNTWHNANFPNRGPVTTDDLVASTGRRSLKMIVASGDEKAVVSDPIALNQTEPRLVEVSALVKTDRLCMLQIDAVNDKDQRLDCFNFIHKAPVSIGSDDWRRIRQVFRPRQPVKAIRLQLCARGVNGYTLDDTGTQPQNNIVGTVWWDNVSLCEPESTPAELAARGVKASRNLPIYQVHLEQLDLGERMLGENVLTAVIGSPPKAAKYILRWEFTSPAGKKAVHESTPVTVSAGSKVPVRIPYVLTETCPTAYTEYRGTLSLLDDKGQKVKSSELWFGTWTTPIDLELGALYLRPDQKQLVRLNLGLSAPAMAKLASVRLEVVRRGTGQVLRAVKIPATRAAIAAQRDRIPVELREDFSNLLLADLDVADLPVQPFHDPQRNWFVRAVALNADLSEAARAESAPFCRQAHEPAQPTIGSVRIKDGLVHVNDKPWLPWGVCYGHVPVFVGPADPGTGKYRDLHNLPEWSIYDRFSYDTINRAKSDFNCLRYVAGSITKQDALEKAWKSDNLYCSTAFVVPQPVFSLDELAKQAGGKDKLEAYLAWCRQAPMVVSVTPGIEEAFGLFHEATPQQLIGMGQVVELLRKQSGKPVMVGHGGYWNRFEFEKAPWYDIYDPETEPLYPANLHTDLRPLVQGKDKAIWLRPQMYEDVPYERWRFHLYVELMRGCRGWQFAHGAGDASLFRGLHGELEFFKPILASKDAGPKVVLEPGIEHWSRQHQGKVYVIAATTHGLGLGRWRWTEAGKPPEGPGGRARLTEAVHELRDETNAYGLAETAPQGPSVHGIRHLPDARSWPKGTRLVQWVRLDPKETPANLAILVKGDGRWTHVASWGKLDLTALRKPEPAYWFLTTFERHARGFLGWDTRLVPRALEYVPDRSLDMGALPAAGTWVKLEVPLEKIGAADKLVDGVGFLHHGGRVTWGRTSLVAPDGAETLVFGDALGLPAEQLARVKISVPGLKAGTKVRVLFEDRELTAADGHFVDDFRGQDLYQRFGGGPGTGYGDDPVAVHLYELAAP
jgi:hypothetical protein